MDIDYGDFVLVDHEVAQEVSVMDLDAQNPRSVKDLIIKEKICNARTKRLKAKLRRVLRNKKEHDELKYLG